VLNGCGQRLSQVTALSGTKTVVACALASIPLRLVASIADGRRQEQGASFGGVATRPGETKRRTLGDSVRQTLGKLEIRREQDLLPGRR
jgi:hypothetical protein